MIGLWLTLACAARQEDIAAPYRDIHEAWTQELRLTHDFELDLVFRATLLSRAVVESQAAYLAAARLETAPEQASRLIKSLSESHSEYVVVFASYSPIDQAQTFAGDDSAAWQVKLLVDGQRQEPRSVERIRRPSADLLALYPQTDRWSALWVARFERADEGREIELQVAGVHGRGSLVWAVE